MNYQHFSHGHLLIPLKLDEGEEIHCEAGERLIVEPFHGCLSCKYYLHDHCLNTPRSLQHQSHPSHPLTVLPIPTYPRGSYLCNACGSQGNGFSFSCAHCEFDLHVHCATLPPTLLLDHIHPHELKLTFDFPSDDKNVSFVCDVCGGAADLRYWMYNCADCDFGTHLVCARSDQREEMNRQRTDDHEGVEQSYGQMGTEDGLNPVPQLMNETRETQPVMMKMQNQLNRAQMMAQIMTAFRFRP